MIKTSTLQYERWGSYCKVEVTNHFNRVYYKQHIHSYNDIFCEAAFVSSKSSNSGRSTCETSKEPLVGMSGDFLGVLPLSPHS